MFKLMKYEFRKQIFSKVLILVALAILEVMFLFGLFTENDNAIGLSVSLFTFMSFAAVLFVSFECIFTFSNDLKTKQSYMLFLTPNSAYKIIGAKVLSAVIYVFLTAAALVAVTFINTGIVLVKYDDIALVVEQFQKVINAMFNVKVDTILVITLIANFLFDLIGTMVIGMTAITLSSTFLSNSKWKAVVSVIFFFGISFLVSKVEGLLHVTNLESVESYYYSCIYSAVVMLVFYFATAWMLDKKVSV